VFADRNPLYQTQSSHARHEGHFVLLPLPSYALRASEGVSAAAPSGAAADTLRDVLREPRPPPRPDSHEEEGRRLAAEIAHWVGSLQVPGNAGPRPARWSDVIVLLRRRTHMAALERALRHAGIPTLSDRRGGLLDNAEIDDLVALLEFLCCEDDLSLAHALRSPLFGCSDEDLQAIAGAQGATWWSRLAALPAAGAVLGPARALLADWLQAAGVLPVHDLLDRIFDQAEVRARYAACVPRERGVQVQANFDAFLELALTLDAGRFPTLTRFLDELLWIRDRDGESVEEGVAVSDQAVRLMTIHGAKGLEAPIVAIADACAEDGPPDRYDVLMDWPPEQALPEHFSLIGRAHQGGAGRHRWLEADREQRRQEDWNLMYVAMTRARQVLIVSGSGPGSATDSWYRRLQSALASVALAKEAVAASPACFAEATQALASFAKATEAKDAAGQPRSFAEFRPQPLPTGRRLVGAETDAIRIGKAWHALLQRVSEPDFEPQAQRIGADFSLSPAQVQEVFEAVRRVTGSAQLARFFEASVAAWNELELVDAGGDTLRIDRMVELDEAVWILDYKWRCLDSEREAYRRQLARYAAVIASLRPGRPVRTALVLSDGSLLETDRPGH
jgi:ATP-dependent helicase/nuclease subunit A